jgi:predicted nuclease of predicted toxin-antitoxin system
MKFLVDECVGTAVVGCLRDQGHDVVAVAEAMPQADDEQILERAVFEARILVTNDKDFGEMIGRSGRAHRGVVLLRLRDERSENKVRITKIVLARMGERLQNRYVVATEAGIRVRE